MGARRGRPPGRRTATTTTTEPAPTTTGGPVNTNYGGLTLASGTKVTYLRETDGTLRVVTPDNLKGKVLVKTTDGYKVS